MITVKIDIDGEELAILQIADLEDMSYACRLAVVRDGDEVGLHSWMCNFYWAHKTNVTQLVAAALASMPEHAQEGTTPDAASGSSDMARSLRRAINATQGPGQLPHY